jgi:hypothetical protein
MRLKRINSNGSRTENGRSSSASHPIVVLHNGDLRRRKVRERLPFGRISRLAKGGRPAFLSCNGDKNGAAAGIGGTEAINELIMPDPLTSPTLQAHLDAIPGTIICEEINRVIPSLDALGINFSVSHVLTRLRDGKYRKPPYLSCRYNSGNLGGINIVAFYHTLLGDWELMEKRATRYRIRIRAAIREEMIHAVQLLTVRTRYNKSPEVREKHRTAELYYERLLDQIVEELVVTADGRSLILTAAQIYYEDWSINCMEKLKLTDKKLHGRNGYLVSELIRQLVQIRFGEPLSEEAKGKAWDKNRVFRVGGYGTTENLLSSMAATLRQAVPKLAELSPTLFEALAAIESMIEDIQRGQVKADLV